jgi:hypothetical protein
MTARTDELGRPWLVLSFNTIVFQGSENPTVFRSARQMLCESFGPLFPFWDLMAEESAIEIDGRPERWIDKLRINSDLDCEYAGNLLIDQA